MSFTPSDAGFMARAIELAKRGLYTTDPNPRVGCVIVQQDEIVGEGWHQRAGAPHAEIIALQAAGDKAKGATVYLTLEPCCHEGKTPPCTEALIQAGVATVIAADEDNNPQVAGQGLQQLQAAGIKTQVGLLADAAITLACPGPAPLWPGDIPGEPLAPRPTGDAIFNYASSMLGSPVVTLPMMAVDGLPRALSTRLAVAGATWCSGSLA